MSKRKDWKGPWPVQKAVDRSIDMNDKYNFLSTELSTALCTRQGPFLSLLLLLVSHATISWYHCTFAGISVWNKTACANTWVQKPKKMVKNIYKMFENLL